MLIYPLAKIPRNKHSHVVMVDLATHTVFQRSNWATYIKGASKYLCPLTKVFCFRHYPLIIMDGHCSFIYINEKLKYPKKCKHRAMAKYFYRLEWQIQVRDYHDMQPLITLLHTNSKDKKCLYLIMLKIRWWNNISYDLNSVRISVNKYVG